MTCAECQTEIFDGELGPDALGHLTVCEECRELDCEVRLNASALAAMREDVMPVRRTRRWVWSAVAAAAAAIVAIIGFASRPLPAPAPEAVAVVRAMPAAPVLPAPVKAKPVRRPRPAKPEPAGEPLLVKFLTDDPDVVIYWLVDPIEGEQAL